VASIVLVVSLLGVGRTAAADPVQGGRAGGYAVAADLAGSALIPPTPESTVDAPPTSDDEDTSIPVDADPVAVNGTLISRARVHQASDIASALEQTDAQQSVAGPYNAQGVGQIEDLEVLVGAIDGVSLLEADLLRGEAVAVCRGGTVSYSASSEVVNLVIGGEDPLSGPLNDLVTQISDALNASPLVDVVDVDVNDVTITAKGASVDALVITLLAAAGPEAPLVQLRLGHGEVSGVACGAAVAPPACSDTADNDGDGVIDADDPGCHTDGDATNPDSFDPTDDDETDAGGAAPACSDTADNDGDGAVDADDPGCHTDGDATNPDSFDPTDDDETDEQVDALAALPATGSAVPTATVIGLLGAVGALELVRRRSIA
jgi:hypothetical protein